MQQSSALIRIKPGPRAGADGLREFEICDGNQLELTFWLSGPVTR
jgi:hypothetical protein